MNTKTMLTTTTVLSSIIAVEGIVFLTVSNENLIGGIVLVVGIILIGASIMMNSNPDTIIFSIEQETYAKLLLGLSVASVVISTIALIILTREDIVANWKKIISKWSKGNGDDESSGGGSGGDGGGDGDDVESSSGPGIMGI